MDYFVLACIVCIPFILICTLINFAKLERFISRQKNLNEKMEEFLIAQVELNRKNTERNAAILKALSIGDRRRDDYQSS